MCLCECLRCAEIVGNFPSGEHLKADKESREGEKERRRGVEERGGRRMGVRGRK